MAPDPVEHGQQRHYVLVLSEQDVATIAFVGGRYCWSNALLGLDVGENHLSEAQAWNLVDAFQLDLAGGHAAFPLLHPDSDLADKLAAFWALVI